jgi:hypothetical protein
MWEDNVDIVYVAILLIFSVLTWGFVTLCEKLRED